jgi:hypothetical protein
MLTLGAPFAAYSGWVVDAATGKNLDITVLPRRPRVDAYVGTTLCASTPAYGLGATLVVPSEELKPGCGRAGAVVTFVIDGTAAPEQVFWKPGGHQQRLTLPAGAPVPEQVFRIVVPGEALYAPLDRTATGFATLAEALGALRVVVDGVTCLGLELSPLVRDDIVFELGRPGSPPACSREGATVGFVDGRDRPLTAQMVLRKGTEARLTNFAPQPPHTAGEPSPGLSPLPAAGAQTPGLIRPPDTGDAGLRR